MQPLWRDGVIKNHIRPAAKRAGITKHVAWHTFRHMFSSLLMENEEDVKTVQSLLRHANPQEMAFEEQFGGQTKFADGFDHASIISPVLCYNFAWTLNQLLESCAVNLSAWTKRLLRLNGLAAHQTNAK